ncbi:unnamed protein product [Owenia fusiformis]|uniref:Uncharacterized protein n=1 Tax=Owenia fusiformis TaxID=6347 RepID=A0A8J1Y4W7_OWEFU|nr:unnamed protein product [Owenia fusiformis]
MENSENSSAANNSENAPAVANGAAPPAAGAEQQGVSWQSTIKTLLVRCVIIYFISSMFRGNKTPPANTSPSQTGPTTTSSNLFPREVHMDMYMFISEDEDLKSFDVEDAWWVEEDLIYGDWTGGPFGDGSYVKKGQIEASESLMNNGSIWLHTMFVRDGRKPNPRDKKFTVYKKKMLNKFKKRKFHKTVNLLTGKADVHPDLIPSENETRKSEILSFWHPNLTINIVDDQTPWVRGSIPQPLDDYVEFVPLASMNKYYPVVYFNEYWNLNFDYMPINETTPVLNLTLTFTPISLFKWQMYAAQGMRNKWYSSILGEEQADDDEEQDSLKETLVETNPYLLGMTIIVSLIHSVFEFLAFKNDIQFWKNRKSLEGLSVRSVFFNVFQSLIVMLYVLDNDTNMVVKFSVCIGLAIECWKIHKVMNVSIDNENKVFGVLPRIKFQDKSSYTESDTKKFDMIAFKYLSWLFFPLLGCYGIYSLMYHEHKGVYSYILSLLYGFLLTFGFIAMTPQLFINYKMKSVAHLPWRMMTYKALNTFIDDIFAFVIKMPTLYRLGCFRDDIVFIIFLYQRWIYPVDPKRMNEFGTSEEMWKEHETGAVAEGEGQGQLTEGQETKDATPKPKEEKKND